MIPRRILVPVDFGEASERALDYAIDLAEKLGAKVVVLHVIEPPVYRYPEALLPSFARLATEINTAADQSFHALVGVREARGVSLEAVVRNGITWEEVAVVAREQNIDLVVIGTHGRRGLSRALMGSVAEMVIRTVDLPVLAVHGNK